MSNESADLAARVDAAARAVPGVAELYYAVALPARVWKTTISSLDTHSVVSRREGVLEAIVSIGVAHGRADDVSRLVAAEARAALGEDDARVTVRVSRITTV